MKRTAHYVASGIGVMLFGIIVVQFALLPRIYTCPTGASCSDSFDPNQSNVLQLLQTGMSWWLKIGLIISTMGLVKLSAYQSWFIMMQQGNTIRNLDLIVGAVKGSLIDTLHLLIRRGNLFLGILLLAQLGIDAGIGLFVGLSIIRSPGTRVVSFSFQSVSQLPDSSSAGLNGDGQLRAIAKVNGWALTNDTSHEGALRGSLVIPDSRSQSTLHPLADGPRISGSLSCVEVPNANITKNTTAGITYEIQHKNFIYLAQPDMELAASITSFGTATATYLWVSNTSTILPNATLTPDGVLHVTLCKHDIFMVDAPSDPSLEHLRPNTVTIPGCKSSDTTVCVPDSVSNAIVSWWGGRGSAFWNVACRGGVVGPLKRRSTCQLTNELWAETVTSMLDGIMHTASTSGSDKQLLTAKVQGISTTWWWVQGVIPLLTLLVYGIALSYTCFIARGNTTLKGLTLEEIIDAAQTEHVRELVRAGRLRKSTMRYENGFTHET